MAKDNLKISEAANRCAGIRFRQILEVILVLLLETSSVFLYHVLKKTT